MHRISKYCQPGMKHKAKIKRFIFLFHRVWISAHCQKEARPGYLRYYRNTNCREQARLRYIIAPKDSAQEPQILLPPNLESTTSGADEEFPAAKPINLFHFSAHSFSSCIINERLWHSCAGSCSRQTTCSTPPAL